MQGEREAIHCLSPDSMLQITTTHQPASDLGYLLHKNPHAIHRKEMAYGEAILVYPEVSAERCTAVILLSVDTVGLARRRGGMRWSDYVNERPYVASSFVSSAIKEMFATAMSGRSKERQDLADTEIPFEIELAAVKVRGGEEFAKNLFEPLGYGVECTPIPLDESFPDWSAGPYMKHRLTTTKRLLDVLNHLYVLIPVLDDDKHYFVGKDEVEKLLRRGEGWLAGHPLREQITRRYLDHQRTLTRVALAQLTEQDGEVDPDAAEEQRQEAREKDARAASLHDLRLQAAADVILARGAKTVLDLGCGEGRLIALLLKHVQITQIVGVDVALQSLEKIKRRLRWDQLPEKLKEKLTLVHGSVTYRDVAWQGFDAAALVEVIEHLDEERLPSLEKVVFREAQPRLVVVTTPNQEYNALFPSLPADTMRHDDHRFEWTRAQFTEWCERVATDYGYTVVIEPVGPVDETHGAPSQMGVFTR